MQASPNAASAMAPKPEAAGLPAIREDLRLYTGPSQRDGSPTWRIYDPIRNLFFEIGWLEFELIARWADYPGPEQLTAAVAAETTLRPEPSEVKSLVDFLAENELLRPDSKVARQALREKREKSQKSWLVQLLHHYLFFRLPIFRPDRFLARTQALTDVFYTRGFWLLIGLLLLVDLYFLSRQWYAFTDSMARMMTAQAFIYYAIAVTFSKVVHELAHAYSSRRYGVRVPTMGVAFLILWPYLYTDTGETWKLADRRKQLVIASAGMAAELALAVVSTLLWALSPEGAAKSVFFVLASTTWIITLAINASPFMRFDGYFVLSDFLNFPNLHERAGACAKWWQRTRFFGMPLATPEPALTSRQRAGLIAFAYVTWAYRLTVFIAIALLVYHMFFKLLGVAMMLLELVWFILLPIWREVVYLVRSRSVVRIRWLPFGGAVVMLVAVVWLVPVTNQVTAPAVLRAETEHAVYAPFPAKVVALSVSENAVVDPATDLLLLHAPDLDVRDRKADIQIATAQAELARMPASARLQETYRVLQEQLAQGLAEKQAVADEYGRQLLKSPAAGRVRDVAPELTKGRWVNQRQYLMKVVSEAEPLIEAYVGERQVEAIQSGQTVRFYPHQSGRKILRGVVVAVDKTPQKQIQQKLIASTYGGPLLVKQDSRGALVAQDAVFRVLIKPLETVNDISSITHGSVRIHTDLHFIAENFVFRILSVLIRESGF